MIENVKSSFCSINFFILVAEVIHRNIIEHVMLAQSKENEMTNHVAHAFDHHPHPLVMNAKERAQHQYEYLSEQSMVFNLKVYIVLRQHYQ